MAKKKYTGVHLTMRKTLMAALIDGQTPCARCRKPMWRSQRLHLDHSDDGTYYLGMSHAFCNAQAGGRKIQALQAAGLRKPGRAVRGQWPRYTNRAADARKSRDW
jgi:hypothetical protein